MKITVYRFENDYDSEYFLNKAVAMDLYSKCGSSNKGLWQVELDVDQQLILKLLNSSVSHLIDIGLIQEFWIG